MEFKEEYINGEKFINGIKVQTMRTVGRAISYKTRKQRGESRTIGLSKTEENVVRKLQKILGKK